MKKVLLIGADGMLGGELRERLEKIYDVTGTTIQTLDICDKAAVEAKVNEVNPYFIINCAAYTNVDGCETNEGLAKAVNGTAVENIAEAARLDRANQLQIVRYIIIPEIKPALVTLFVLTFVESWNMVEQPIIFLEGPLDYPLSVFLAKITENSIGVQSVCGILCLIPVTFLFLYYRKELTDGLQDTLWS